MANTVSVEQLVAEYEAGTSLTRLAARHHLNLKTVRKILHLQGLEIRQPKEAISDEELPALHRLRAEGLTQAQIAERYGCTRQSIAKALERPLEPGALPIHQHQTRLTRRQIDNLVADYNAGHAAAAVARKYGVHESTARSHLAARGIPIRRTWSKGDLGGEVVKIDLGIERQLDERL